jgi:hypothetical protein
VRLDAQGALRYAQLTPFDNGLYWCFRWPKAFFKMILQKYWLEFWINQFPWDDCFKNILVRKKKETSMEFISVCYLFRCHKEARS